MASAKLDGCQLGHAHLERVEFHEASLREAVLIRASLEGANLVDADLTGANLNGTVMTRSDCRRAKGIVFDETRVDQIRLTTRADDPWSVLRRNYTGPNLAIILLLSFILLVPMITEAIILTRLGSIQEGVEFGLQHANTSLRNTIGERANLDIDRIARLQKVPVWRVMLRINEGWLHALPIILLLVYNALRAYLTYAIGLGRDNEVRYGVSPSKEDYLEAPRHAGFRFRSVRLSLPRPWRIHKWCTYLKWFAISWASYEFIHWLWTAYVWLPSSPIRA